MSSSTGKNGIMRIYSIPSVMGSSPNEGMKQFKKDFIIEGPSAPDRVSICLNAVSAVAVAYLPFSICNEVNSVSIYTKAYTYTCLDTEQLFSITKV